MGQKRTESREFGGEMVEEVGAKYTTAPGSKSRPKREKADRVGSKNDCFDGVRYLHERRQNEKTRFKADVRGYQVNQNHKYATI
jgi:hypothetical protein